MGRINPPIKYLKVNINKITSKVEMANLLAEIFSENYKVRENKFQNIKRKEKKYKLNFSSNNSECYKESIKGSTIQP